MLTLNFYSMEKHNLTLSRTHEFNRSQTTYTDWLAGKTLPFVETHSRSLFLSKKKQPPRISFPTTPPHTLSKYFTRKKKTE